jgi:hypothetical protein
MALQSINYAIENSIVTYLSSSYATNGAWLNQLALSGSNTFFYTGINNMDIATVTGSSVVVVECNNVSEVAFNTRVYAMDVDVTCCEIAYDMQANNIPLGQMPNYIFNEFVSSSVAAPNFTNNVISVYQVQIMGFNQSIGQDTIESKGSFRIVGGLK